MKEFFGIDLTTDKKNETLNCAAFLAQKTPGPQVAALEKAAAQMQDLGKQAQLPPFFNAVKYILYIATLLLIGGMLRGIGDVGLEQAWENAPWLFWLLGILAALWAVLALWARSRSGKVVSSEDYQVANHRSEMALQACYTALGVPANAPAVDVMLARYKIKNGKMRIVTTGTAQYANPELRLFLENETLYLADAMQKYAIPLREIRELREIKKQVSLAMWNKTDHFEFGRYAQYKIRSNQYGSVFVKPYYELVISHCGETYLLHFPSYELPLFQSLIRMNVTK